MHSLQCPKRVTKTPKTNNVSCSIYASFLPLFFYYAEVQCKLKRHDVQCLFLCVNFDFSRADWKKKITQSLIIHRFFMLNNAVSYLIKEIRDSSVRVLHVNTFYRQKKTCKRHKKSSHWKDALHWLGKLVWIMKWVSIFAIWNPRQWLQSLWAVINHGPIASLCFVGISPLRHLRRKLMSKSVAT